MTVAGRLAILVAVTAGLAAAAATDQLLAAAGAARIVGPELGLTVAPLLVLALLPQVRRQLVANRATTLLVLGAAWTLAPLLDEHVTRAVVMDGALPDLIHHLAGWLPLIAGARLGHRAEPTVSA